MTLNITKATVGGSSGTWGQQNNDALDAIVAYVGGHTTPADGQLLSYSASLNAYTPVNATGAAQLALAQNVTGTAFACSASGAVGTFATVPGTGITVPSSNGRPVTLHYGATWQQTVAGDGSAYIAVYETTGTATVLEYATVRLPNSTAAAVQNVTSLAELPLGVVTTPRTFEMRATLWAVAASSPTATLLNAATNPTFLRAVAG